jgi:hypothetical protein
VKRAINRVLRMPVVEHDLSRSLEVVERVSADLVADLARMTHRDDEAFADWPRVTVEYLVETGRDEYGDAELTVIEPGAAQMVRIHASVLTVPR